LFWKQRGNGSDVFHLE